MEFVEVRKKIQSELTRHYAFGNFCHCCGLHWPCQTYLNLDTLLDEMDHDLPWSFVTPRERGELEAIGVEIGELVEQKNKAYGNSYGKAVDFLKLMFPDGIPIEKYPQVLFLARIFDKLSRVANDEDAFGEAPYADIAGYAIRAEAEHRRNRAQQEAA